MRKLSSLLFSGVVLCTFNLASAAPYSELVVFGDSLSDVGNVFSLL
jgi:phospholipase/lecithinase/hemolysin